MCFTYQERAGAETLATTDPIIKDFYSIVNDPRLTEVDMSLKSVQDAIGYLFLKLEEANVVEESDVEKRIASVLSGTRL